MHRFFSKPETLLRLRRGPLGNYLDRYADWLSEQGFCRVHARLQLVQIADFSLWLDKRGLTILNVQPATVDSFIEDRRRRMKPRAERSTLQRFLKLVRPEVCTQVSPPLTASQVVLQDFRRYFLEERGAAPVSYLAFQPILHQFLSDCFPDGTVDCARLTAKDVIGFVRRHAYRHSPGRAKLLITALRVFLRYLCQRGSITSDLAASVPRVAMWPGSTIPKFLSPDQVRQVLAQCDQNSAVGERNYAILLLLRLQMRMTVAIVPRLFVAVVAARWNELVHNCGQVMLQTRLKFNRAERGRAPDVEDVHRASLDSRGVHDRSDLLSEVVHVPVTLSADRNLLLIAHHLVTNPPKVSRSSHYNPTIYIAGDGCRGSRRPIADAHFRSGQ